MDDDMFGGEEYWLDGPPSNPMGEFITGKQVFEHELVAALARAEAAEKRVAELEEMLVVAESLLVQLVKDEWQRSAVELADRLKAAGVKPVEFDGIR